jgi:hypothetical protein
VNVFNLMQWCFDRVIPVQSPHSGVNVSPRMEVPDQGFSSLTMIPWHSTRDSSLSSCRPRMRTLHRGLVGSVTRHVGVARSARLSK